jgi:hypothetical protein
MADKLEEAADTIREQKAVKADDAVVPKNLWEKHLFDTTTAGWGRFASEKWGRQKEEFRSACDLLKTSMLAYWKKLVVCWSLTSWVDSRHPIV